MLTPKVKLNASGNSIKEVPDMHGHWSRSLVILNLSSNNLTEIPWTICQLTALHDLNLSSNLITQLPAPTVWSIYSLKVGSQSGTYSKKVIIIIWGANHPYSQLRAESRRTRLQRVREAGMQGRLWLPATSIRYDHGAQPRSKVFDFSG